MNVRTIMLNLAKIDNCMYLTHTTIFGGSVITAGPVARGGVCPPLPPGPEPNLFSYDGNAITV